MNISVSGSITLTGNLRAGVAPPEFPTASGTRMFVIGNQNDMVYQYSLDTPWDITTADFIDSSNQLTSNPQGLFFRPDGTNMFVSRSNNIIERYDLSIPLDITTVTSPPQQSLNTDDAPFGISFRPDGTNMFMIGVDNDNIYRYDLLTPWDLTTTSTPTSSFDISEFSVPSGLFFRDDGTQFFVIQGNTLRGYTMTTPWDITTAQLTDTNSSLTSGTSVGVYFRQDGSSFFVVTQTTDEVHRYDMSIPWDITTADFVNSSPVIPDSVPTDLFFG